MAELDAAAAIDALEMAAADDSVSRLAQHALQHVLVSHGGPLPRAGHHAYVTTSADSALTARPGVPTGTTLDVRF
jgi:hypothetical protein